MDVSVKFTVSNKVSEAIKQDNPTLSNIRVFQLGRTYTISQPGRLEAAIHWLACLLRIEKEITDPNQIGMEGKKTVQEPFRKACQTINEKSQDKKIKNICQKFLSIVGSSPFVDSAHVRSSDADKAPVTKASSDSDKPLADQTSSDADKVPVSKASSDADKVPVTKASADADKAPVTKASADFEKLAKDKLAKDNFATFLWENYKKPEAQEFINNEKNMLEAIGRDEHCIQYIGSTLYTADFFQKVADLKERGSTRAFFVLCSHEESKPKVKEIFEKNPELVRKILARNDEQNDTIFRLIPQKFLGDKNFVGECAKLPVFADVQIGGLLRYIQPPASNDTEFMKQFIKEANDLGYAGAELLVDPDYVITILKKEKDVPHYILRNFLSPQNKSEQWKKAIPELVANKKFMEWYQQQLKIFSKDANKKSVVDEINKLIEQAKAKKWDT